MHFRALKFKFFNLWRLFLLQKETHTVVSAYMYVEGEWKVWWSDLMNMEIEYEFFYVTLDTHKA